MLSTPLMADQAPIGWKISPGQVAYPEAVRAMEDRVERIVRGEAAECVWLLEHPPIYTAGTSANCKDLIDSRFPVFQTGRGGQYTYHGPGQRVAYVMLNLKTRRADVRAYVCDLENWLIKTLALANIKGERREKRVGIWVAGANSQEDKIAAIGVRLRHWVTFHGVSVNVDPDLTHFSGIVPCGINDHGVTSFEKLGLILSMSDVDVMLRRSFEEMFGPTQDED